MSTNTRARVTRAGTRCVGLSLLVATASTLFAPAVEAVQRELNRTRSIYVPVRFEACEHMTRVSLTVTGEPYAFNLGTRIFQFTYYPEKKALLPELAEVWIEGEAATEEGVQPIRTNLLVTPERITSSRDLLERGQREIEKQLRRRMDVRLPEAVIHIKCRDSCPRWPEKTLGPSDLPTEAEVKTASEASRPENER